MKIGFSGLGRMGSNMVARLLQDGHEIVVLNRSPGPVEVAVEQGAVAAKDYKDLADQLSAGGNTPVMWLMLPAEVTDDHFKQALEAMPEGGIIIDGGNSDFRNSRQRSQVANEHGVRFLDVGTSGGILGREKGYALMVGGNEDAAKALEPIFDSLAPKDGWGYFGEAGSGHFTKMVHNAIEYGMMESYAEGYRLLKEGPYKELDLAKAARVWQHGSIVESLLNELARQALTENPKLDGIGGVVAETGEARWALEFAKEAGLPMQSIQAAFDVRLESQKGEVNFATKLLAAMRNKLGGHDLNPDAANQSSAAKK